MSITEKLVTIAENEPKVYEAGKKAEHDRFWDDFQVNGTRTDYYYLFYGYGWTAETFKPKYDLRGTRFTRTFAYTASLKGSLIDILNKCGVVLDTSKAESVDGMFLASGITEVPHIDVSSLTATVGGIFNGCTSLRRIEKVTYTENANCYHNTAYQSCSALTDIEIAGVIAGDMNFRWSPLSKTSIESIINHLSTTVTGKTLSLSKAAVNTAFETSTGAADGSTSEAWQTLISPYSNWTISLL